MGGVKTKRYGVVLAGLKNLDSLGLAHNKLKEINARVFSHLTLLNSLELDGNRITYIDQDAFSGLEGKTSSTRIHFQNWKRISTVMVMILMV